MKLFNTLLEVKIGKKDLQMKAVYISNSTINWEWTYFIYYYDMVNHTFYINDFDYAWTENRVDAMDIIEKIINTAYKQEMNSFVDILKKMQMNKKPKVFCFYKNKPTWIIFINKVYFKIIKSKKWEILSFQLPKWD